MEFTFYFLRVLFADVLYASPLLVFLVSLIALIGYRIGRIEGWSMSDALYHAFINATTVGYGDFRPTCGWSKTLVIIQPLLGFLLLALMLGVFVGMLGRNGEGEASKNGN